MRVDNLDDGILVSNSGGTGETVWSGPVRHINVLRPTNCDH